MIKKSACFTDIHFGKRNNSIQHNEDCLNFVKWFIQKVKDEGDISHVIFLGDWFENRNAVNVLTMDYANEALMLLDSLGIPILILVGNHDLHHRENRKIFSTKIFNNIKNVQVISENVVYDEDTLLCPYLFKDEYPELAKYAKQKYWYGHFEFRNFVLTGTSRLMEHGPDHTTFSAQKYIFSGHYHRRQCRDNVVYIGNTFAMDYGDAGDFNRGMCLCNHETEEVYFYDWEEAPVFLRAKLSNVLDGNFDFYPNARVKCLIDIEITYTEAQILKEAMLKDFQLREFILEENALDRKDMLTQENEEMEDLDFSSIKETVRNLLSTGINNTATINSEKLIAIWNEL